MIVTSCPLRISLVGGSTDHPHFLQQYERGSVISFPSTLRTYVSVHQDIFGVNTVDSNYVINYSKKEIVKVISEIKNELVRECFQYLNVDKINCTLTSDIFSVGSGLAASSSYLQALIKSIYVMRNENVSEFEICKIAEVIEKKINPLVGQQDFYGSMGGLKRINFFNNRDPEIKFLSTQIFNQFDMHLLYTGILRNSAEVLESIDINKCVPLLQDVDDLESAINKCDTKKFHKIIERAWRTKKQTSNLICANPLLKELDIKLSVDNRVLSHKLCGAGNGGYFLVFAKKNSKLERNYQMIKPVGISETGLKYTNLKNEFTRI